jgi:hypothetical protein
MQRRRSHTVSILLGTGAKTALPGDPFRLGFIRLSRVLWLSVLVVMLGGLLEPEAAAQTVSFGAKTDFGTGARSRSVAVGDFNGDGKLDLAVANPNSSQAGSGNDSATVSILLGTGTGSFGAKTDFGTGRACSSVAVGDFNGDGKLDLAVANFDSNTVSILLGTGTGSFGAKTDFGTGSNPASVAVGDFNGDGKLDLAVANLVSIFVNDPSPATVSILLNTTLPNPIDDPQFFVRQHYLDFLSREPDSAGLAFWTNKITLCGTDHQCIDAQRINISAAFFLSIEFQETGYLAYRTYKVAYGDTTSPNVAVAVPIIRLQEFLHDAQRLGQGVQVGIGDWQAQLEANKNAYTREFVTRQRFVTAYPLTMTAVQFVDQLNQNAGNVLSPGERDQLIAELSAAADVTIGRASVLRKVAENAELRQQELNRAFVLMQYYGYLRRNPDDAPDTDFGGWKFWLDKLNQFNGNYIDAEMVKAFIVSTEYRQRFGQP